MKNITKSILIVISITIPALPGFASIGGAMDRHAEITRQIAAAQVRLKTVLGKRCEDAQEMTPAQCVQTREDSFSSGCINRWEKELATANAWSTFCAGKSLILVCPCSCFDASTKIMAHGASLPEWVEAAEISVDDQLVTLSPSGTISTMDQPESWETMGLRWTTSGPEENDMYVFKLRTGRDLSVTQNHAILLYTGVMKAAKNIQISDRLINAKGVPIEIVEISRRPAEDGHVYNFLIDSNDRENHLVVAEGVVVGDSIWQDHFGELLDKIFIRK